MKSCLGKVLRVDLSTGIVKSEKIPDEIYDAVLSGKGLAAWYLLKNIPAGADPLDPDNILCFASGALTGTGALLCGRWTVACKSPLTGGWGDANCGGVFSPAIKQCGYDAILFSGISPKPVYLYLKRPPAADNPNCRFRLISQRPSAKGERASIDFVRTNCEIRNLSYFVSLRGGGCAVPFEPPPFVHRDGLAHVGHGNDFPRPTWDPNPSVEPGAATPGSPSRKSRRALPTTLQLLRSGHARNPQRQQRAHPAFRVRCSASTP